GYVAEATPPELVLTNLTVRLHEKHWDFVVGGMLQPMTNAEPSLVLSNGVVTLGERLRSGPFRANPTGRGAVVSTNTAPKVATVPNLGSLANWSTRSRTNSTPVRTVAARPVDKSFMLEGYIQ
ncbi:MAG: hypothetical protein IT580_10675, partial [Verrucomicrobiales bacterium]|nr:hypothetical protein [Verrucomicrobiales bacterium]